MSEHIRAIEAEQMKKKVPNFRSGDTVIVKIKVKEGSRERLQAFEGVVIAKRNRGLNSAFTVRKVSHGEGVERAFQTHSPVIESITVKRRGDVKRAKLYYLRELSGRKARIKEKIGFKELVVEKEAAPEEAIAEDLAVEAPKVEEKLEAPKEAEAEKGEGEA